MTLWGTPHYTHTHTHTGPPPASTSCCSVSGPLSIGGLLGSTVTKNPPGSHSCSCHISSVGKIIAGRAEAPGGGAGAWSVVTAKVHMQQLTNLSCIKKRNRKQSALINLDHKQQQVMMRLFISSFILATSTQMDPQLDCCCRHHSWRRQGEDRTI